ncbi:MAG: hypothetical protein KGR26_10200 [Cyanobacteria bacterium REEB65]|nr:hypothetical protein [Cyanobacteria bacterium REEB65]
MSLIESLVPDIEAARLELLEDHDLALLVDLAVEMGVTAEVVRDRLEDPEWRREVARRIALKGLKREIVESLNDRRREEGPTIIPAGAGVLVAMQGER